MPLPSYNWYWVVKIEDFVKNKIHFSLANLPQDHLCLMSAFARNHPRTLIEINPGQVLLHMAVLVQLSKTITRSK